MTALKLRLSKLRFMLARPRLWPLLARGFAPSIEHMLPFRETDFATVLDVGANRGQFAGFAALRWPRAEIACFEPLPAARSMLAAVLQALAPDRSRIFPMALGAREEVARLHIASADDSSSLLPLAPLQKTTFGTEEVGTLEVQVGVLDMLAYAMRKPVLLKIDVQGTELSVLQGATRTLHDIAAVYVEASSQEFYQGQSTVQGVFDFLETAGFRCNSSHNAARDRSGTIIQADYLFVRNDEQ